MPSSDCSPFLAVGDVGFLGQAMLWVAAGFIALGISLAWGCLFHWQATQRRFGPWLRWCQGWYPASRLGAFSSGLTSLWFGLLMLAVSLGWQERMNETVIGWLMAVWGLWMVIMAIRDYRLHKKR